MCTKLLIVLILSIFILTSTQNDRKDCIEGETWYEVCKKCTCFANGHYECEYHEPFCRLGSCMTGIVFFGANIRCHCSQDSTTVCVPLTYQPELNGKPCLFRSYIYDTCTLCRCNDITNTFECMHTDCKVLQGGICNEKVLVFEDGCYVCSCTYTKFRKCVLSRSCLMNKEKPGRCYVLESLYELNVKRMCLDLAFQECSNDYSCPGRKKCCHVVDCYLRCVDPIYN